MTSQYGPYGLTVPDRGDPAKGPDAFRALVDSLTPYIGGDTGIAIDALGARPAASGSNANSLFIANDGLNAGRTFASTGSAWIEVAVNLRLTRILAVSAGDVPLRVTGASGQTANLIEVLNNAATTIFGVSSTGAVTATSLTSSGTVTGTGLVSSSAGVGLPNFATASLPAAGPIGMLVYDTTTAQVKVKTASGAATYTAVGAGAAQKAQGQYQGNASTRTITVGFTPDLVFIGGASGSSSTSQGLAWLHRTNGTLQSLEPAGGASIGTNYIDTNGFTLAANSLNLNSQFYNWTAFKFV